MLTLTVNVPSQTLFMLNNGKIMKEYRVSTAKNGVGETRGSEQTPRGLHIIRAKIGAGCLPGTVFVGRRPTGELFTPALREKSPQRDWILTRIFWLSGLEKGKNRLGQVDTMQRYIYIHGTPDDVDMRIPGSKGCIRMKNHDIIDLFEQTPTYTQILIQE